MDTLLDAAESILASLWLLMQSLGTFLISLGILLRPLLPVLVWAAWWYWVVDWRQLWPALRRGGWMPALLAAVMIGYVWGMIDAQDDRARFISASLTKTAIVAGMVAIAIACGLLQGYLRPASEDAQA